MANSSRLRDAVVRLASSQIGYRALGQKQSVFRTSAGDWDGAFLTWAFAENGMLCPDLTSTTAGLAWFAERRRLYVKPKVGDIAFLTFAYDGGPGQPHVGLVSGVNGWKDANNVLLIEGQTSSGRPREAQDPIGVFSRHRYRYEILAFARPVYRRTHLPAVGGPVVLPSHITTGGFAPQVTAVQEALGLTVGLSNARRGVYDENTRAAYTAWQRLSGHPPTGTPTVSDLYTLSVRTGMFRVKE